MPSELAVLGLDGLSIPFIKQITGKGAAPTIKHIMARHVALKLYAFPPSTLPSWTSIMTGLPPTWHGITGFFKYDRATWEHRVYNALDLQAPRIHEILSYLGYKSIVFNPIPDYPLIPARNSVVVSNLFFTPRPVSSPPSAYRRYFGDFDPLSHVADRRGCDVIEGYRIVVDSYLDAVDKALLDKPRLLWVNLNVPDAILHKCPRCMENPEKCGLLSLFNTVDKIVKALVNEYDNFIIVSDHGFRRYSVLVSVNTILVRHGFARATDRPFFRGTVFRETSNGKIVTLRVPGPLYKLLKRTRLSPAARKAAVFIARMLGKELRVRLGKYVDPLSSKAFMPLHVDFGVYVNDASLKDRVVGVLAEYNEFFEVAEPGDDRVLPEGPFMERLPDIIVKPRTDKGVWVTDEVLAEPVLKGVTIYDHDYYGVFIARLSNITVDTSGLGYVTPSEAGVIALCSMGIPLPKQATVPDYLNGCSPERMNYLSRWRLTIRLARTNVV